MRKQLSIDDVLEDERANKKQYSLSNTLSEEDDELIDIDSLILASKSRRSIDHPTYDSDTDNQELFEGEGDEY